MNGLLNLYLLLVLFIANSCSNSSDSWCIYFAKGLKESDQGIKKVIFIDEKKGFVFGENDHFSYEGNSLTSWDESAIIGKTQDGGRTWKVIDLGSGYISSAFWNNRDLLAIRIKSKTHDSSTVLKYNSVEDNWQELFRWKGYVDEIIYHDNLKTIIVAYKHEEEAGFYISTDGCKNWILANKDYQPIYNPFVNSNGRILYITTSIPIEDNFKRNILIDYDLNNQTILTRENLPSGFDCKLMKKFGTRILMMGIEHNLNVVIYERLNANNYKKIYTFLNDKKLSPENINVCRNEIFVMLSEVKSIYVEFHAFRSLDNGKKWVEETLPESLNASEIAFYNDVKQKRMLTWISCGLGRIQIPCIQNDK